MPEDDVFDGITSNSADNQSAKIDADLREAMRMLMSRREGRVFVQWLTYGQDPRTITRLVMAHVEEMYVR